MSHTTYLRRRAAAKYLRENRGIPTGEKTLAKLACVGGGPIYRRFGRIPLYLIADLDAYAEAKLSKPSIRPPNMGADDEPRFFPEAADRHPRSAHAA